MYRWDIINALIEKNNYQSYLEIGYYKGWSFDQVKCETKLAVDPNPSKRPVQEALAYGGTDGSPSGTVVKMTSDDWFAAADRWVGVYGNSFDIIFIDGLHEAEQVYRDIQNSLQHLSPNGTIVLHDCNPPLYEHTTTGIDGCWTGDTYKGVIKASLKYPVRLHTVDTDWGVGIMRKSTVPQLVNTDPNYNGPSWEEFSSNRDLYLNLITPEQFKEIYL